MKGTTARVLTAIVLIPLVVSLVLWGPTWLIAILIALVVLLSLNEYFSLSAKNGLVGFPLWTKLCAMFLIYAQWSVAARGWFGKAITWEHWEPKYPVIPVDVVFFIFVVVAATMALVSKRGVLDALKSVGASAAGLLFIALPISYLIRLRLVADHGERFVLFVLCVVWVGDSVAFLVGRSIGRHKMAPSISPQKSWEGAVGNLIGSALVAVPFLWWLDVGLVHLIGAAVLASIAGQIGDLLESAFKRGAGVKDSGALLPGHGGMYDRVDALILASPVVWWYFEILAWFK